MYNIFVEKYHKTEEKEMSRTKKSSKKIQSIVFSKEPCIIRIFTIYCDRTLRTIC